MGVRLFQRDKSPRYVRDHLAGVDEQHPADNNCARTVQRPSIGFDAVYRGVFAFGIHVPDDLAARSLVASQMPSSPPEKTTPGIAVTAADWAGLHPAMPRQPGCGVCHKTAACLSGSTACTIPDF